MQVFLFALPLWLEGQGLTPSSMSAEYSFSHAMRVIKHTPVLVQNSVDDYILNSGDLPVFRDLQAHPGPLEVTRMMNNGGHVGLDFNPAIAEAAIDFAVAAPNLKV